jgi:Phage Tail Collar Domain
MRRFVFTAALLGAMFATTASQAAHRLTRYFGEVQAFAMKYCPEGWSPARGYPYSMSAKDGTNLFPLLGYTYNSGQERSKNEFGIPDLHEHPPTLPDPSARDSNKITWCILIHDGVFPPRPDAH